MQNTTPNGQPQAMPQAPEMQYTNQCAYPPQQPAPGQPQGSYAQPHSEPHQPKPKRKRGFFRRFISGYLMIVGALFHIYWIVQWLLDLLVYISNTYSLV